MHAATKISICLLVTLLAMQSARATDDDYAANKIPAALLKNANAVTRQYHKEIRIAAPDEVYVTTRYAITILNEKGDKYAELTEYYNSKLNNIESVHGWQYDNNGKEINKLKKNELQDISAFDGAFVDDSRVRYYSFHSSSYPYTVVYEIETKQSNSVFMPTWSPQDNYDVAVENADLAVTYPKDFALRYRTFHIDNKPSITTTDNESKLTISLSAIHAYEKPDEFTPVENFHTPTLILASDKCALAGVAGSMANWQDFGTFFYQLNVNRDLLPDETKQIVHQLTDTCHSQAQKIAVLYEYLKKNTRYVAIQLGIGGWQTLDAAFVAQKEYGDCKALTNYMKALLKVAGITSYQALAYGGVNDIRKMQLDFTYNAFNHVILCVPQANDTVWLECTSKDLPAGYLSGFTSNRYVLLLTPSGGYPIKTPEYGHDLNRSVRKAVMNITNNNEIKADITAQYFGIFWDKSHWMEKEPKTKMQNYLNSVFTIPTYTVTDYSITNITSRLPEIDEHVRLSGSGNITYSGNRMFVTPHVFKFPMPTPESYEERTTPFQLSFGGHVTDTTIVHLNGKYSFDGTPKPVNIAYAFATFTSQTYLDGDVLMIVSNFDEKEGVYPAEQFADYIKLSHEINSDAVNKRLVLVKQN